MRATVIPLPATRIADVSAFAIKAGLEIQRNPRTGRTELVPIEERDTDTRGARHDGDNA